MRLARVWRRAATSAPHQLSEMFSKRSHLKAARAVLHKMAKTQQHLFLTVEGVHGCTCKTKLRQIWSRELVAKSYNGLQSHCRIAASTRRVRAFDCCNSIVFPSSPQDSIEHGAGAHIHGPQLDSMTASNGPRQTVGSKMSSSLQVHCDLDDWTAVGFREALSCKKTTLEPHTAQLAGSPMSSGLPFRIEAPR